jgi:hypothetical protein
MIQLSAIKRLASQSNKRVHTGVATINPKEKTMTTTTQIPATQNEAWGFWGTMNNDAQTAWPIAMTAISDATCQPLESVRLFLDSRYGRHFADDVINEMLRGQTIQQAIDAAVTRWMGWTIGRQTSKQYGIPKGLPYLTGFVIHCEVTDESFEAEAA